MLGIGRVAPEDEVAIKGEGPMHRRLPTSHSHCHHESLAAAAVPQQQRGWRWRRNFQIQIQISDSNSIENVFLSQIGTRDSVCNDARNVSGDQNVSTWRRDCMQRRPMRCVRQNVLEVQNVLWMNFCLPPLFIFASRNVSTPKTVLNNFSTNSQQ